MCTTNGYTLVYPDGTTEQQQHPSYCPSAGYNQVCPNHTFFQHPIQYVPFPTVPATAPYMSTFPPTPTYSGTPNRSGDESERSNKSSSSKKKRRSSGVYYNGHKILDLNKSSGERRDRERIVLVDNPPTPRTPPMAWAAPHTAPSSPNTNAFIVDTSPGESSRRRPIIVDERNSDGRHVRIEVIDNSDSRRSSKHSRHSRHPSSSSHDSRYSTDDEERRQRRRERKALEEQEAREARTRERIAKANAEINSRPPVPMPDNAVPAYVRPAVEVPYGREAELEDSMRRLSFEEARREEKAERLARKEERREQEAQRRRLEERLQPRRRATVGPGSRRHRIMYDDGTYRWE